MNLASRLIALRYQVLLGESLREKAGKLERASLNFEGLMLPALVFGAALEYMSLVWVLYVVYYVARGLYAVLATSLRADSG